MSLPTTSYEYRVAYISDGSIEELLDPSSEYEADSWIEIVNDGGVDGVEPGGAFKQRRKTVTTYYPWESVLDGP